MKKLYKIKIFIVGIVLILASAGTVNAQDDEDCPASPYGRTTTSSIYVYTSWNSGTNTMTYIFDTINKPGAALKEVCSYPTPGFTGSDSDLTPLISGWEVDRPGSQPYFGFIAKGNTPLYSLDGSTGVRAGTARYTSGRPSSEIILLHIFDTEECGGGSTCWVYPSASPLPTPTPTPTPTPGDTTPPTKPLCPVAIAIGPTAINFSWWASTDNVAVAEYKVWRSTDNINFYHIATTTNIYYIDTGLTTGVTYYYSVEAIDTSGNPSLPSDIVYATPRDINPPTITIIPSNIIAEATSPSGANVTYSVSATDDIDTSLEIICTPYISGSTFPLGLTTVTCRAIDDAGNIGSTIATIRVVDTTPPTDPTGLTATTISNTRIDLNWIASYDAVGIIRYSVYRSIDNINWIHLGTTLDRRFSSTGLSPNTQYFYYIRAFDTANNPSGNSSTVSNITMISPPPEPVPTPEPTPPPGDGEDGDEGPYYNNPPSLTGPSDITIQATSEAGTIATFSVSAYDIEDGDLTNNVTCSRPSGSTFPLGLTTVSCNVTDSSNNRVSIAFTVNVIDNTIPTTPTLTATPVSSTRIDLSWTASSDIVGIKEYRIYRSINNINFVAIGTSITTSYFNFGLLPNTTYYYYIVAYDKANNPSNNSNIASATTFVQPPSPPSPPPEPEPSPGPTPEPTETPNPCLPQTGNTPRGENIEVTLTGSIINVMFDAVTQCGETASTSHSTNYWASLPKGYKSVKFYDISTTADFTNYVTITITYDTPSNIDENSLRIFHYENGQWNDVTTALNVQTNTITGRVSSLSPFSLAGSDSSSGSGTTIIRGSSFGIVGFLILSMCLIIISILKLKKGGDRHV